MNMNLDCGSDHVTLYTTYHSIVPRTLTHLKIVLRVNIYINVVRLWPKIK